jgi:transaldolase/glucose-6-phosphate isomerase
MNPIQRVHSLGQSIWLDYIRRDLMESGELAARIESDEVRGVTSNPTIFEKAIAGSDLYTTDLRAMAQAGWETAWIFEALSIDDIRAATKIFLPLYEGTNGGDGFVSIEVNPELADDTEGTIREVVKLWDAVNRPNVMIKIPATQAGIPAIERAITEGINVNVTLIFSLDRYAEVMEAYLRGLENRLVQGHPLDHIASVASFFVSRIDTAVDERLGEIIREGGDDADRATTLLGKAAIASAKVAYAQYKSVFDSDRYQRLAEHGARVQRPLWASTSTKNPAYHDTRYVDSLIGLDTVNTIPPQTLEAFHDHGEANLTLEQELSVSVAQLDAIERLGISLQDVTDQLEREGVKKFIHSYRSLLATLRKRAQQFSKELAGLRGEMQTILNVLDEGEFARRLWEGDVSLWPRAASMPSKTGSERWLTAPQVLCQQLDDIQRFVAAIHEAGYHDMVLLCTERASQTVQSLKRLLTPSHGLELTILDTVDPSVVARIARKLRWGETLFVVASGDGSARDFRALLDFFWERAQEHDQAGAGDHFVAMTHPGSPLESLAQERRFRRVFRSAPDVENTVDFFSIFTILPAALMGLDVAALLRGGMRMAKACGSDQAAARNPGLYLGSLLTAAARQDREKITIVCDPGLEPLAEWMVSSAALWIGGTMGCVIPIAGEPPGYGRSYPDDRTLLYLREGGDLDRRLNGWVSAQHPVIVLDCKGESEHIGAVSYQWLVGLAVACHLLQVNPFDQAGALRARKWFEDLLHTYERRGTLPLPETAWEGEGVKLWASPEIPGKHRTEALPDIIAHILQGEISMVSIQMYMQPNVKQHRALARLRRELRDRLGVATTVTFSPHISFPRKDSNKERAQARVHFVLSVDSKTRRELSDKGIPMETLYLAQAITGFQMLTRSQKSVIGVHMDSPKRFLDVVEAFMMALDQIQK